MRNWSNTDHVLQSIRVIRLRQVTKIGDTCTTETTSLFGISSWMKLLHQVWTIVLATDYLKQIPLIKLRLLTKSITSFECKKRCNCKCLKHSTKNVFHHEGWGRFKVWISCALCLTKRWAWRQLFQRDREERVSVEPWNADEANQWERTNIKHGSLGNERRIS